MMISLIGAMPYLILIGDNMNYSDVIVWDLETTGKDPKTAQIVQIGAVVVNARKWEIKPGTEFNILAKPLYGEECAKAGLEELTDGAIKVHGKTHDILSSAQNTKSALENFKAYVDEFNFKKNRWGSPIPAGYNSIGYDHPILARDLERFGITDFFHPIIKLDVMHHMWMFFENDKDVSSLSADNLIRGKFGYNKGIAHDALGDVVMTAEVLCKTMHLMRKTVSKVKFDKCMES